MFFCMFAKQLIKKYNILAVISTILEHNIGVISAFPLSPIILIIKITLIIFIFLNI